MARGFAGTYSHSLDAKGRVIIPAGFREKLGTGFTITINAAITALTIYPLEKWESIYEQLIAVDETDDEGTDYKRFLVANAQTDLEMDAQGRILIPAHLRELVGLTKDVTFAGMLDRVELWDTAAFTEKQSRTRADFAEKRKHMNQTYAKKPKDTKILRLVEQDDDNDD